MKVYYKIKSKLSIVEVDTNDPAFAVSEVRKYMKVPASTPVLVSIPGGKQ